MRILYTNIRNQDLKFFNGNVFACPKVETSSFRRLGVDMLGLQIIKIFFQRHKLHLLHGYKCSTKLHNNKINMPYTALLIFVSSCLLCNLRMQ